MSSQNAQEQIIFHIISGKKMYLTYYDEMKGISVADTAFWIILDFVSDTAFCLSAFSLVFDKLQ